MLLESEQHDAGGTLKLDERIGYEEGTAFIRRTMMLYRGCGKALMHATRLLPYLGI
jgi:hypothetical protein